VFNAQRDAFSVTELESANNATLPQSWYQTNANNAHTIVQFALTPHIAIITAQRTTTGTMLQANVYQTVDQESS